MQEWRTCTEWADDSKLYKTSPFDGALAYLVGIVYACDLVCLALKWVLIKGYLTTLILLFILCFTREVEHHTQMDLPQEQNGSLYLRIFLAAENKCKEVRRETGFLRKVHWNLKCWREKRVLFEVPFLTVFLLSQVSRSVCDHGVCTEGQSVLLESEKEINGRPQVHVTLFSLFKNGQRRETSGWWSPKEKWHKVIGFWGQAD